MRTDFRTGPLWLALASLVAASAGCVAPCPDSGQVCTVAGTGEAGANENEARATRSPLYGPMDVIAWPGSGGSFFIGDWNNHKIRLVEDGTVSTVVGTEFLGDGDPDFLEREGDGVPGIEVALNHPTQAEWNPVTGKLLLPSWHNHRIREWTPETGHSVVVCANTAIDDGNGANAGFAGDGGPAADALMAFPNSIAVDPDDGSFWFVDQKTNHIRWVARDYSLIDSIAGNGTSGYEGDGGPALEASFNFWDSEDLQPEPSGSIEYDGARFLYVADTTNHAIRVIDTADGTIDTLPVAPEQPLTGGTCDPSALCFPGDVELGPDGRLWIADTGNHVIRAYDLDSGVLETVVGTLEAANGEDGLPALETALRRPHGIDFDDDGALLIADTYNHRIRRVTP